MIEQQTDLVRDYKFPSLKPTLKRKRHLCALDGKEVDYNDTCEKWADWNLRHPSNTAYILFTKRCRGCKNFVWEGSKKWKK